MKFLIMTQLTDYLIGRRAAGGAALRGIFAALRPSSLDKAIGFAIRSILQTK